MSHSIQYTGDSTVFNEAANQNHTQGVAEVLMASIATFKWGGGSFWSEAFIPSGNRNFLPY